MVEELRNALLGPLLRVDIRQVVIDSMEEHYDDMADLNRQQLEAGQTADGNTIKPFYKPITIAIKKKKGQSTDRVTLKDTESFYQGIRAEAATNGDTELTSTDSKTDDLVAKYGVTIFGLSVASLDAFGSLVQPTIQNKFLAALQ